MSITSLQKLTGIFPINIRIFKKNTGSYYEQIKGDREGKPIELGLYLNHYFINEPVKYSKNYITHYKEYCENPKFINCFSLHAV